MLKNNKDKKKDHITRELPALCELLPYREFLDGVIVFSDRSASLGCGWEITGRDIECLDTQNINDFSLKLRSLLNNLPDGVHAQFIYTVDSDYSDIIEDFKKETTEDSEVAKYITNFRAESFYKDQKNRHLFRPRLYLFIRYTPQTSAIKKFKLFESANTHTQRTKAQHKEALQELNQIADDTFSTLINCGFEARRLKEEDTLKIIYEFLNPDRSIDIPPPKLNTLYRTQTNTMEEIQKNPSLSYPSAREQLVFSDLVHNENYIHLDKYYYKVITLKTTPEFTHACMIKDLLIGLPFHFYFSLNIQVPEQQSELEALQRKRKMTHALAVNHGLKASDLESESKLADTEELLRELINSGSKIFYMGATIILKSKDKEELKKMTRMTLSKIRELNSAEGLEEKEAAFPIFLGALPLTASSLVRSRRMKTSNVADFIPFFEPNRGNKSPVCLFKNREGGLFKYDSHSPEIPNYSSIVTGVSGSGKSFLVNYILLSHLK